MRVDLFADGNDFSWTTMQRRRNLYYQKQLANQISEQLAAAISSMTRAMSIHLNTAQNLTINTSSISMTLGRSPLASLPMKVLQHFQPAEIRLPSNLYSNTTADDALVTYQVRHLFFAQGSSVTLLFVVHHATISSC
jgi:hypothetical protein